MSGTVQGEFSMASLAGAGQTIGTATVTLLTIPGPASGGVQLLEARAAGTDGTDVVALRRAATIKNITGTVSVAGATDFLAALGNAALAGAALTFVAVGPNVELQVTGVLTKTIAWTAEVLVR